MPSRLLRGSGSDMTCISRNEQSFPKRKDAKTKILARCAVMARKCCIISRKKIEERPSRGNVSVGYTGRRFSDLL